MSINSVEQLPGANLSTVSFVRDYVEFHFDGPVLRALADPMVKLATGTIGRGHPDWRDTLCALIDADVATAEVVEGDRIVLGFLDGRELIVPFDYETSGGPEVAHFMPEDSFAGMWIF